MKAGIAYQVLGCVEWVAHTKSWRILVRARRVAQDQGQQLAKSRRLILQASAQLALRISQGFHLVLCIATVHRFVFVAGEIHRD